MMIIAVASGKGGTGKTTVVTSLALAISGSSPVILDCDVEAPNAHLFLKPQLDQRRQVSMLIPEVNESRCAGCGRCAEVCQFHAIVVLAGKVLVFPELCHGCGSCGLNCPEEAILVSSPSPRTARPKIVGNMSDMQAETRTRQYTPKAPPTLTVPRSNSTAMTESAVRRLAGVMNFMSHVHMNRKARNSTSEVM